MSQILGISIIGSLSTAKGLGQGDLGAVPSGSQSIFVQALGQNVRWRADGTNPTASVGFQLVAGALMKFDIGPIPSLKFIEETSAATLVVLFLSGMGHELKMMAPPVAGGAATGPVSIADGSDSTLGAVADAAATAGGTGTVSAKLRRISQGVEDLKSAQTSGGLSAYNLLSIAAVETAAIKASAGQAYSLQFFNLNAAARYVRLYNKATAPLTSDTPVWRGIIPGSTTGGVLTATFPNGLAFATGIGIRVTAAVADNDATVLAANEVIGNVQYK